MTWGGNNTTAIIAGREYVVSLHGDQVWFKAPWRFTVKAYYNPIDKLWVIEGESVEMSIINRGFSFVISLGIWLKDHVDPSYNRMKWNFGDYKEGVGWGSGEGDKTNQTQEGE